MDDPSPAEVSFIKGVTEVDQFLCETVIFEEYAKVEDIATLLQGGHFQVDKARVLGRYLDQSLQAFFLPEDNDDVVGREPIVVISVGVVSFDEEPVDVYRCLFVGVELGEYQMQGHVFMLISDLRPRLNQVHS